MKFSVAGAPWPKGGEDRIASSCSRELASCSSMGWTRMEAGIPQVKAKQCLPCREKESMDMWNLTFLLSGMEGLS